jgi:benzodiazapine receptor
MSTPAITTEPNQVPPTTPLSQASKLQAVNYANILAYLLNVGVTYGVGVSGYFPTNAELSAKYQTLVTPSGYAFAIWGIIFLAQFIWMVLQALPAFRSSDVVIKGVGYWYVAVCVAQCAWSIVFANEWIEASLGAMLSILVGLVVIVQNITAVPLDSSWKYWGFKFPFQVHCGWIWAASVVNTNVVLVAQEVAASAQVISAWASLGLLALVSMYYLCKQNYVVPLVLAWASYAVRVELTQPQDSISTTFDAETVEMLQQTAFGLAIAVLATTLIAGLWQFRKQRQQQQQSSSTAPEENTPAYSAMEL